MFMKYLFYNFKYFYKKFIELDVNDSTAKRIWQKYIDLRSTSARTKTFLDYYESLKNVQLTDNVESRKHTIQHSDKSMHIRYRELFDLEHNDILYNSMVNDNHRTVITRWRLSCHCLFIETGRYKRPFVQRNDRKCIICQVIEDEAHALFTCIAHIGIRNSHQELLTEYSTIKQILSPKKEGDIIRISKYIRDIEKNMESLKMVR